MSTELTIYEEKALDFLSSMGIGKDLAPVQKTQFLEICKAQKLNPFLKEVYPILFNGVLTIVTNYQEYIKKAERTGDLDYWNYELKGSVKWIDKVYKDKSGKEYAQKIPDVYESDLSCTVTIKRKSRSMPFQHTVFFEEFNGDLKAEWTKKPKFMLMKTCIGQAFRIYFPEELAGMPYTDAEGVYDNTIYPPEIENIEEKKQQAINNINSTPIEPEEAIFETVTEEKVDKFEFPLTETQKKYMTQATLGFLS